MSKRRTLDGLKTLPSSIARDAVYIGNLHGNENYLVHGEVHGNSDVQGMLMLAPGCRWKGNIVADNVVIRGRVEGDVIARFKLELRASAHVTGNISGPLIALADGAVVQGRVSGDSAISRFKERRS